MKQKIKEALKQKYGTRANKELGQLQLGIGDEVFERVAASVETLIPDESAIEGFVNSENTLNLLKSYQSVNDRLRAAEAKNEPAPKPSDTGNNPPEPEPEPKPQENPVDMAKIIAEAVANAIKPISDELAGFKAEKTVNDTIAAVNTRIDAWGYGKGYPKEMAKARTNAMELYEAYGKKWTADELEAKIKEKFNQEVHDKGLDTSKPFESDGGAGGEADLDMTEVMKIYQKSGRVAGKE
jgi:hypothetical protein